MCKYEEYVGQFIPVFFSPNIVGSYLQEVDVEEGEVLSYTLKLKVKQTGRLDIHSLWDWDVAEIIREDS